MTDRERMNKHTPGPWNWTDDGRGNKWGRDELRPSVIYATRESQLAVSAEDARLIAAAPDLLAALQGLLRGIFDGPDEADAAMLIAKARDAVNKATGEK